MLAGICVGLLGFLAIWEASGYRFGSIARMGSGFFPIMLGSLALALGAALLWVGWCSEPQETAMRREPSLRPLLFVLGSILCFALLIERAGLLPAVFATCAVGCLADPQQRPLPVLVLSATVAVTSTLLFIYGLGLPLEAIGG